MVHSEGGGRLNDVKRERLKVKVIFFCTATGMLLRDICDLWTAI
jgi:hypothetical protein